MDIKELNVGKKIEGLFSLNRVISLKSVENACFQFSFTSFKCFLESRDLKEGSRLLILHNPQTYRSALKKMLI